MFSLTLLDCNTIRKWFFMLYCIFFPFNISGSGQIQFCWKILIRPVIANWDLIFQFGTQGLVSYIKLLHQHVCHSITVSHFIVPMVVSTDKSIWPISLDAYYNTSLPPAELDIQCVHVDKNYYERRIWHW